KVPTQWKTSKTVLLFKKGDLHDIGNYRPICLLSVVYKLFTRVVLSKIDRTLNDGQPCKQEGFREGFSAIDHIHTITRLTEVLREDKRPLCLTFIESQRTFDSIEIEAVMETLESQGVCTQNVEIFEELYKNFTIKISLLYNYINVDVNRGVRQGDTIPAKLFTATLQNVMRTFEWDNTGVKIDCQQVHHLCLADDIVLVGPNISQTECMFSDFDKACGNNGLRVNLKKT
ncbi:hypothetical protein Angca_009353, partial [Angiostrongylus cantonensis]